MFFRIAAKPLLFLPLFFLYTSFLSATETGYISDQLIVKVRESVDVPSRIVDRVRSDEQVAVLEEKGKFLRIKTKDGRLGWIESQYVKNEPPKTLIIQQLQQELEVLREKMRARNSPDDTSQDKRSVVEELEKMALERDILAAELEILKNQIKAANVRTVVKSADGQVSAAVSSISDPANEKGVDLAFPDAETASSKSTASTDSQSFGLFQHNSYQQIRENNLYWFITGAIVFLTGILSGRLTGRGKKRRIFYS